MECVPLHALDGPRFKIERASKHLAELDQAIRRYTNADPNPYDMEVYQDPEQGAQFLKAKIRATPDAQWGAIIGDFAFNLRSALDQTAWQFAKLAVDDPGTASQFPIFRDNPCRRKDTLNNWRRQTQHLGIAYDYIESLQPYHRPDPLSDRLWILHDICITDKHRVISTFAHQMRLRLRPLPNGGFEYFFMALNDGDVVAAVPIGIDPHQQLQPNITARVVFDIGAYPPREGVGMAELNSIHDFVRSAVFPTLMSLFPE